MESLVRELEKVKVELPEADFRNIPKKEPPDSYKSNNKKERLILCYAENFRRQFRQLYGDRKALLLTPLNECGIEKFICTSVRPTRLPYKELYDYDGAAAFVADYVTYTVLKESTELVSTLNSSTLVLGQQEGNCFEMSVVLCSLLLGVGYDAYCVCGYADREICLRDQTRRVCPVLEQGDMEEKKKESPEKNKYAVRTPRDLASKFTKRMEDKELSRIREQERIKRDEEQAAQTEREKPPPDDLHGLRVHCWVLVLSGKREVPVSFFIDSSTGKTYPVDSEHYLGIESVWNHKNYWVNMQDCGQGLKNMVYDLGDSTKWEYFFPNVDKPMLIIPPGEDVPKGEEHDVEEGEELSEEEVKDDIDLPPSWVQPIVLSQKDFEMRCPLGKKTLLYNRAKFEKFAEYLNQDGLVVRLTTYKDLEFTKRQQVQEEYKHREDCLYLRVTDCANDQITDYFRPGRPKALKEHTYFKHSPGPEAARTMIFYAEARLDGLVKREQSPLQIVEMFQNREDHLCYKEINFLQPTKKFEPATGAYKRQVVSIIEKFERNPAKLANEDIAEKRFFLSESKVIVLYHLGDDNITQSRTEFTVPHIEEGQAYTLLFSPQNVASFEVDSHAKSPKNRVVYELLDSLVNDQERSRAKVRASEREVRDILSSRTSEEINCVLSISVYDVARNETAKQHRLELERKAAEEERLRKEKEMDYLAPYLARLGDPESLNKPDIHQLKEDCLKDLRTHLVETANIIQARFEKETSDLQKKQSEYQEKQNSLSTNEAQEYVDACKESMFRIHILEQRLARHKTVAPMKYREMEDRLRLDERLQS